MKKICTKCGRELPLKKFGKNRNRKDGLSCWCKECCIKANREHYLSKYKKQYIYRCSVCGKEFKASKKKKDIINICCSRECAIKSMRIISNIYDYKDYSIIEVNSPKYGRKEFIIDREDSILFKNDGIGLSHINNNFYAVSYRRKKQIHRIIMSAESNVIIDHINGNTLDNRKENLRIADKKINSINIGLQKNNTSGYKNIWIRNGKYCVQVKRNYKKIHLGTFKVLEDAIKVRNNFLKKEGICHGSMF